MNARTNSSSRLLPVLSLLLLVLFSGITANGANASVLTEKNEYGNLAVEISERLCPVLGIADKEVVDSRLRAFENRVKPTCGENEIVACYSEIWQALNAQRSTREQSTAAGNEAIQDSPAADGAVTPEYKNTVKLCWHLVVELSDPSQVNQGNHNTCALAALESYLYARQPSLVCATVLHAHSGKIVLANGETIAMPPQNIEPDLEARFFHADGTKRSYASQLFQIAAANIYWHCQRKDPRQMAVPYGSISYVQDYTESVDGHNDTRERLIINWAPGLTEQVVVDGCWPDSSPSFSLNAIDATYRLLAGRSDSPALLSHKKRHGARPVMLFASEDDLCRKLQALKQEGALPAIISVNPEDSSIAFGPRVLTAGTGNSSYHVGSFGSRGSWHVVCINDYDETSNKVAVDNFWGSRSDHLGENKLSLHELFRSASPQLGPLPAQLSHKG